MIGAKSKGVFAACLLAFAFLMGGCASSEHGGGEHESSDGAATSSASIESQKQDSSEDRDNAEKVEGDETIMATSNVRATLNGKEFTVVLADNGTASAFASLLPLEAGMSELNGNEKYAYLDERLPSNPDNPGSIEAGDVMLYGTNCLVVFYEPHPTSYTYTRIGKIADTSGLAETLGKGSIAAAFSAE